MTLVIAKSFINRRDAIQGFNRVGRFGDKCSSSLMSDNQEEVTDYLDIGNVQVLEHHEERLAQSQARSGQEGNH